MNVTFACPECETTSRQPLAAECISCPACAWSQPLPSAIASDQQVDECVICGCKELFARKNFSQRLGVTIVVIAAVTSSIAWGYHMQYLTYGILFTAALLDLALYFSVGNLLQCYRCHAEYRGLNGLDSGAAFNLETHERYRQQAIRTAEAEASQAKGA